MIRGARRRCRRSRAELPRWAVGESASSHRRGEDEDVDDPPADAGFRAGIVVGLDQPHLSVGVLESAATQVDHVVALDRFTATDVLPVANLNRDVQGRSSMALRLSVTADSPGSDYGSSSPSAVPTFGAGCLREALMFSGVDEPPAVGGRLHVAVTVAFHASAPLHQAAREDFLVDPEE